MPVKTYDFIPTETNNLYIQMNSSIAQEVQFYLSWETEGFRFQFL